MKNGEFLIEMPEGITLMEISSIATNNDNVKIKGYNIFENNYWIGTVDSEDTEFVIDISELPVPLNRTVTISIEAFDYDGETSKTRAKVMI